MFRCIPKRRWHLSIRFISYIYIRNNIFVLLSRFYKLARWSGQRVKCLSLHSLTVSRPGTFNSVFIRLSYHEWSFAFGLKFGIYFLFPMFATYISQHNSRVPVDTSYNWSLSPVLPYLAFHQSLLHLRFPTSIRSASSLQIIEAQTWIQKVWLRAAELVKVHPTVKYTPDAGIRSQRGYLIHAIISEATWHSTHPRYSIRWYMG